MGWMNLLTPNSVLYQYNENIIILKYREVYCFSAQCLPLGHVLLTPAPDPLHCDAQDLDVSSYHSRHFIFTPTLH